MESATTGRDQPDITGRIGQYAHGNEPSHHVAWLYHLAGLPQHTADRVHEILTGFYTAEPDGLIGNEDCGQMSSWYVLAALGLYDVAPTSQQWLVVPPLFARTTIRFEDGRTFTTRRVGAGQVQRVTWNGKPLARSWLRHDEVVAGGELVFELGPAESVWGLEPSARPGDLSGLEPAVPALLPAPWASAAGDRFRDSLGVHLACAEPRADILWTDGVGVDPREGSRYTDPLTLTGTTILHFVARDGERMSPMVTARFDAITPGRHLEVASVPNPQYTAGGPEALIDGRRGTDDWRTGAWQGYQGQDLQVTVRFDAPTVLSRAGAGFLQDMRSWILMPRELQVEVSADGVTFAAAGGAGHEVPDAREGVLRRDLTVPLDGRPVRAVRLHAVNHGPLPAWHPGAGGNAFIFVDEIIAER